MKMRPLTATNACLRLLPALSCPATTGEFGGALETPGGEIDGNFCDVFEFGDRVYAVDSLSHLGLASTTIYSFDRDCKHHKIFSAENLDFKARYATGERAYILLSDRVGENPKSVLLEISENGDMLKQSSTAIPRLSLICS